MLFFNFLFFHLSMANKEAEEEECERLRAKYDQLARQNDSDLSTLTSRVIASKQALAQERSGEIASTCEYCGVVISRYEKGEKGSYDYTSLCLVLA